MESKVRLRKRARCIRDDEPEDNRQLYSRQITTRLCEQKWYAETDCVFVYSAIQSEVNLAEFCRNAWKDSKILFFPKVFGDDMVFYRIDHTQQLCEGAFHVQEPDPENFPLQTYRSQSGSIPILVPGLAFSKTGERIGYGKGYYDRYIAGHRELIPIGICFECQLSDVIPTEPQDVRMVQLVTECNVYDCSLNTGGMTNGA